MQTKLLKTKFFVPPLPDEHVPRQELLARLRTGTARRLTVMTAPAGFGKSTALAELLSALAASGQSGHSSRLSLDPSDDEPQRFWRHFGHGLGQASGGLGAAATAALGRASAPPISEILTVWLNELAESPGRGILVLDDFHSIQSEEILGDLTFLIDHLPPSLHLILAGRRRPSLPLSRWRGRGDLYEISGADLLMSLPEAEDFLNRRPGLTLDPGQIVELFERCEGWPTALSLAASLLSAGFRRPEELIRELPAQKDMADYMAEEILAQMDGGFARQLMELSILDAFDRELCAAILTTKAVDPFLENLESADLPLIRLDRGGHWLRFHHLFRDFLRRRLERLSPGHAASLHLRASVYFESQKIWDLAFAHARRGGDGERALSLLTQAAAPMIGRGESRWLIREANALDLQSSELPTDLLIELAKAFYIANQTESSRAMVAALEIRQDKDLLDGRQLAQLQVQRGAIARSRDGDLGAAIEDFEQALISIPEENTGIRRWIGLQLSIARLYNYELDAAVTALSESAPAVKTGLKAPDVGPALLYGRRSNLAQVRYFQGELQQAEELCQQILRQDQETPVPQGSPGLSLTYRVLGLIDLQRGNWRQAKELLKRALDSGRLSGFDEMAGFVHLWLAELARDQASTESFDEHLSHVERLATRGSLTPVHLSWQRALLVHRHLDEGDLRGAERLVRRFPRSQKEPTMINEVWRLAWARTQVSLGDLPAADQEISALLKASRRQGRRAMEIELLAWRAWLQKRGLKQLGRPGHANAAKAWETSLTEALSLARDQSFVRPFLMPPRAEMVDLFSRLQKTGLPEKSLALCNRLEQEARSRLSKAPAAAGPALTGKESEVLAGLAAGRTNAQIADDLGIAITTVKTHLKHLFAKLGARRRTQAVARARELGAL